MKKYIKIILSICLALCTVFSLGFAVACQTPDSDNGKTFTIIVNNEDGTPAAATSSPKLLQYCAEGDTCTQANPDSKGKITVDISTSKWQESPTIHIQFLNLEDGYKAYDEEGHSYGIGDGPYIDHHTVKSVKFTIKAVPEDIEAGYEYDVNLTAAKSYSATLFASAAVFEADVHGGEFDLSVVTGNSATPITATLNASKSFVDLDLGAIGAYGGNSVTFKLTPKNATSNHISFNLCPVFNLGDRPLNVYNTDVYKAYFNLPENAQLTFSDPFGGPLNVAGFPITLTIGTDEPVVWNSVADIAPISTTQKDKVAFVFKFGDYATSNLSLLIENANSSSSGNTIVLGETIQIDLPSEWDGKEFTFTSDSEDTTSYYITITDYIDAKVQLLINSTSWQSDPYYASEYDGIIEIELEAGVEYTIIFGTDNPGGESYSVVLSKKGR